jgi:hypothetical protein
MLKKNDRLIEIENQTEWRFDSRTRGPDIPNGAAKATVTWTCVLKNDKGERRFIPETKMSTLFERRES